MYHRGVLIVSFSFCLYLRDICNIRSAEFLLLALVLYCLGLYSSSYFYNTSKATYVYNLALGTSTIVQKLYVCIQFNVFSNIS